MIAGYGLFAFRDPNGIRPLVYGQTKNDENYAWGISSESVALNSLGFEDANDLAPGEAMFVDMNGKMFKEQCSEHTKLSPCIFEYVYFARPDSVIDGISVHQARLNMGTRLAQKILHEWPHDDIDVVIPVPDSGVPSALGYAEHSKIPFELGIIRNH